jgi:hypothetical protein
LPEDVRRCQARIVDTCAKVARRIVRRRPAVGEAADHHFTKPIEPAALQTILAKAAALSVEPG